MKIGLIGNMNNNNFAFLRYLIDLGYDAKLIVFKNETSGNSSHFSPEADSWQFEKWNKYIVQCELNEDPVSIFNFPVSYFFGLKTIIENLFNRINCEWYRVIIKSLNVYIRNNFFDSIFT